MKYLLDHQGKPHVRFFEDICAIPHGSKQEKQLSDWLVQFAKDRNLWVVQDNALNVIIKKPASKGFEAVLPVMLQGHMDMVCEKNADSNHQFATDPLELYVEDGWLKARGTTLGADDGVAVAYMLALLDSQDVMHPPLECVFTTDEETGLHGALALDPGLFEARRLISMDGGGESVTMISSAGGMRSELLIPVNWERNQMKTFRFAIRGLSGGHSGGQIDKEKGNANKLAIRILMQLIWLRIPYQLAAVQGGLKDNAIPRECDVAIAIQAEDEQRVLDVIQQVEKEIQIELEDSDPKFHVIYPAESEVQQVLSEKETYKIVKGLHLLPNGMMHRSMSIENLVVTSLNMGTIATDETGFTVGYSLRSTLDSRLLELAGKLELIADMMGATITHDSRYPGWNYQKESALRDLFMTTYQSLRGTTATLAAAHGGVEAGIFKNMFSDMDIVTLGPVTLDIHTPQERLHLESFDRTYEFLKALLAALK